MQALTGHGLTPPLKPLSLKPLSLGFISFLVWFALAGLLGTSWLAPLIFTLQLAFCCVLGFGPVSFWRHRFGATEIIVSTIFGVEIATSLYALCRLADFENLHYAVIGLAALPGCLRLMQLKKIQHANLSLPSLPADRNDERNALITGMMAMLVVGSAFYFSGRIHDGELTFFGPMARDHAFHLAIIGRLAHVMPPDNFVISGYPILSYHFFGDLMVYLFAKDFGFRLDVLDAYFRLFPGALYFAIGFLTYWIPAKLCASPKAGFIGAALLLFGADFSWILGGLQTAKALLAGQDLFIEKLFGPWLGWNGFGTLYPLFHLPAYYHGLLFFLAGLATLTGASQHRFAWILSGLI